MTAGPSRLRVDDRAWGPIRRILGWDPSYVSAFPGAGRRRPSRRGAAASDPAICYHMWRGALPADLAVGRHVLEVRATDPDGHVYSQERPLDIVAP